MPHNRFYYPLDLKKDQSIHLTDEEFKHLKVMRLSKGDQCELVNGKNYLATAFIEDIQNKQAVLTIKTIEKKPPPIANILCVAFLKAKKMELILEKSIELGIAELWIFNAEQSEIKEFKKTQIQRFEKLTIAAIKQCGRFDMPKIKFFQSLSEIPNFDGPKFYGDTSKEALLFNYLNKEPKLIIIGPEKGLTINEISFLKGTNIVGIKLAQFILRAETAAITAASLMSHSSLKI